MKLSLTFQPFVKPIYKEFCIQKIQQTVSQIKHHFKFSKQHIYQSSALQQQTHQKLIANNNSQHPMDRTVKNAFFQKDKVDYDSPNQSTDQFQFSDYHAQTAQKKSNRTRKSQHHIDYPGQTEEKLQKEQLILFLRKVEQTMQSHTEFYHNIIQKIQLMNRKQLNLQKMIIELSGIVSQRISRNPGLQSSYLPSTSDPQQSVTFRNNKFLNKEIDQQQPSILINSSNKFPNQTIKPSMSKFQNYINKTQESKALTNQYSQQKQLLSNELSQNAKVNNFSQNADFLISFMRLQQEFNKIKKKSQYNQFHQLMKVQTL